MGTFNFGYAVSFLGPNLDAIAVKLKLLGEDRPVNEAFLTTMVPLGAVIGVFVAMKFIQKGRLLAFIIMNIIVIIGAII